MAMETANVFILASIMILSLGWTVILNHQYNEAYSKISDFFPRSARERVQLDQLVLQAKSIRAKQLVAGMISMVMAVTTVYETLH